MTRRPTPPLAACLHARLHACLTALGLLIATAADAQGDSSPCPAPQAAVLERFLSAECADCWAQPAPEPAALTGPAVWRFDWIVPGSDAAPLSAAALADARDRLARRGQPAPAATALLGQPAAGADGAPGLTAELGPAWLGRYMALALRLTTQRPLPAGSSAWLAMVELLPAGTDSSPVARALVRNVAGPMPLDSAEPGQPLQHLRAMRWPETADPTRLQARAWIEGPDGTMLAVAADRCAGP